MMPYGGFGTGIGFPAFGQGKANPSSNFMYKTDCVP
jgi:hypothetical protein